MSPNVTKWEVHTSHLKSIHGAKVELVYTSVCTVTLFIGWGYSQPNLDAEFYK